MLDSPVSTVPDLLNLWVGPTIKPQVGDWERLRDFLLNIICRGEQAALDYLLGFLAHAPSTALELLAQPPRWEGCPYVVPNPETLLPFNQIHRSWNNARQAAGLPDVRMHDLRHSMTSNMINSGRSLYEVGKVLGHSQLATTQRYAHLSQETLLAAVDAAADAANWKPMEQAEA